MEKVYILHHVYEYDDIEDVKLVGVFKTEKDAKIAINNLKKKSGFIEYPNGFDIDECQLNKVYWEEGFNPDDELPDPEMTQKEKKLVAKLTQEEINEIDSKLLLNAINDWRKVAMIVGVTMGELENRVIGIPDLFYAQRIRVLVEKGQLEAEGNLSYMRYSEVRLPGSVNNET